MYLIYNDPRVSLVKFRMLLITAVTSRCGIRSYSKSGRPGKCLNYRIFKCNHGLEKYLLDLPDEQHYVVSDAWITDSLLKGVVFGVLNVMIEFVTFVLVTLWAMSIIICLNVLLQISLFHKPIILLLIKISIGYLPNSPYSIQLEVDFLTPRIILWIMYRIEKEDCTTNRKVESQ
jgi:hypothetical protein